MFLLTSCLFVCFGGWVFFVFFLKTEIDNNLVFCELCGDHIEVFLHCWREDWLPGKYVHNASLFKASSRGLTNGWVGWGWQPLWRIGRNLVTHSSLPCFFHCRSPCVTISEANSHPALLPQQHRSHHVGVLKTDFLVLLKPRDPAVDEDHSFTILWTHHTRVSETKQNLRLFSSLSLQTNMHTHSCLHRWY